MDIEEVQEERFRILRLYLSNPSYNDTDLYYSGLIGADEYLDHKCDKLYKLSVACSLLSNWKKEKEYAKNSTKKAAMPLFDDVPRVKRGSRKPITKSVVENPITPQKTNSIPTSQGPPKSSLRLTFKIGGNRFLCVCNSNDIADIPEKPIVTKHPENQDEDEGTTKKTKNNKFQGSDTPLTENEVRAKLKSQKNVNLGIKKYLADYDVGLFHSRIVIPEIQITNPDCVQRSMNVTAILENSHGKKRLIIKNEDERASKKMKYNESRCPENPHIEDIISAKLKSHLESKDAVLVIKKELTNTDTSWKHNRLAIPERQITNLDFLNEEEHMYLTQKPGEKPPHLPLKLIEPSGHVCDIKLVKWNMNNKVTYNLISPWNDLVARYNLCQGTPIKLYSFREGPQLYLALIIAQP